MSEQALQHLNAEALKLTDLSAEEFLQQLAGPAIITQQGIDNSRYRAMVTLLHGNEPSGLKALLRWLQSGQRPAVNAVFIIASVGAALAAPGFYYRMLPGHRDLNRCFRPPYNDREGQLALAILDALRRYNPESLIDIHNTSGTGPAFGVAVSDDPVHDALITPFAPRLIITDLRLGALMEVSEFDLPTVTVECGGNQDPESDEIAWDGLCRYLRTEHILQLPPADFGLEKLTNPVRLELCPGNRLVYAEQPVTGVELTLRPDIEHFNFGTVSPEATLGWLGKEGLSTLTARDSTGHEHIHQLYRCVGNELKLVQARKLFMITTNPDIATSDCLWYCAH